MHALVVDDESQVRKFVGDVLKDDGWEVTEADSAEHAFEMLRYRDWSVVFCDVMLGGADGFSVLRRFKDELPETKVVLMTGHASGAGALDATAFGAYDYLLKPFGLEELQSLSRTFSERPAKRPAHRVVSGAGVTSLQGSDINLVGRSTAFIEIMKQVGRVASTNLPVLLTGESGTGKELIASALHLRSERSGKAFLSFNCGAVSPEMIESELFGQVNGSLTGADQDRRGLWEEADGGTVFLDEVTETTPAFQVKLLRALQENEIRRVGSNALDKVDVRVIAASDRDVEEEVKAGRFREDLFYRLNAVAIALPPLRERREDILPLAKSFVERVYTLNPTVDFSSEALEMLEGYAWPGNIRELENAVVRAAALCQGTIRAQDLPERIRNYRGETVSEVASHDAFQACTTEEWLSLAEVEGRYVTSVLAHTNGNKQAAARLLGIDRKTLERKVKRYKIQSAKAGPIPSRAA
jgi:two-component system response regulator AtoC